MPDWPAHVHELRPWRQAQRAGTEDDQVFSEVEVRIPPLISARTPSVDSALTAELESALAEIVALDHAHGAGLGALGVLLLRTESVASSKIEYVQAGLDDYARALHGSKGNASAVSMVAATDALAALLTSTTGRRAIKLADLLAAHATLMRDDPMEQRFAGRLRVLQNWIGGSDYSPRNALYVPPPPETVAGYMADLVEFSNRDDLSVLMQAAVAHAQFESIHPFTDGNGRIGRALINTILRRRGATTRVVVPLASALVAHRDRYFDHLVSYRNGDPEPLIRSVARGARLAAAESRTTALRLDELPSEWPRHLVESAPEVLLPRCLRGWPADRSFLRARPARTPRLRRAASMRRLTDSARRRSCARSRNDVVARSGESAWCWRSSTISVPASDVLPPSSRFPSGG